MRCFSASGQRRRGARGSERSDAVIKTSRYDGVRYSDHRERAAQAQDGIQRTLTPLEVHELNMLPVKPDVAPAPVSPECEASHPAKRFGTVQAEEPVLLLCVATKPNGSRLYTVTPLNESVDRMSASMPNFTSTKFPFGSVVKVGVWPSAACCVKPSIS